MTHSFFLRMLPGLLAMCWLAQAGAQPLHPRWHGVWSSGAGDSLRISDKVFSTKGAPDCQWRNAPATSSTECLAFYNGTVSKAELLRQQNQLVGTLDQVREMGGPKARQEAQALASRNQSLLDQLGNETFRIVTITPPVKEDDYTGDVTSYYLLNETTIYRVTHCEPCLGDSFTLTAYPQLAPTGASSTTPAVPPPPPVAQAPIQAPSQTPARAAPAPAAETAANTTSAGYRTIDYTDFLLDHGKMAGQRVRIKASIQSSTNVTFLRRNELDTNPVLADTDDLSREDRKKILTLCQHVTCSGIFYGQVKSSLMFPRIKIERIEWQGGASLVDRLLPR